MVWIRGGMSAWENEVKSGNLWFSCNTRNGGVRVLGPRAFIARMMNPAREPDPPAAAILVLRDFESLRGELAARWIAALERFQRFAKSSGVRLILVSEGAVTPEMLAIHRYSPLVLGMCPGDPDPADADLKVHGLLDCASRIAAVPIKRISEKAANFLEDSAFSQKNEALLELVVEGIRRSDGHTLRFRDLLPNFAGYFDPEDPLETYCN